PKSSYYSHDLTTVNLIHAVLVSADYTDIAKFKLDLAKRDSLLTHILPTANGGYNLHLLVTERTVSINVTATGGNVQLMSIDDRVE
ncbi:MAG: hypothetical protein K2Y14_07900, partial [Burkholderiales bacterium]|nr:hypothetical protein [Burkholderiales bacterium]